MVATTRTVQAHTSLGNIAANDKLLGERVAGQTRLLTYTPGVMSEAVATNIDVVLTDATLGSYSFRIDAAYVGQTSLTTLGTVTTGTWTATTVAVGYGGSGRATATEYAPICGGTTTTGAHQSMASSGSAGQIPRSAGASAVPVWSTATFADTYAASTLLYSNGANTVTGLATANSGVLVTDGTGIPSIATNIPTAVTIGSAYIYRDSGTDVTVADGGTGRSTATAYAVLCGGTTSTGAHQSIASVGSSGEILTSNGAGALPTFQAAPAGTETTQSDQETATNTTKYVSSAKQHFHPSAAKFWLEANGAGTSILASYNVTSITDTGTGVLGITIATDFSSTSWAPQIAITHSGSVLITQLSAKAAGTCTMNSNTYLAAATDPSVSYGISGFGDFA